MFPFCCKRLFYCFVILQPDHDDDDADADAASADDDDDNDDLYIIGAVCLWVCHKSHYFAVSPKSAYK